MKKGILVAGALLALVVSQGAVAAPGHSALTEQERIEREMRIEEVWRDMLRVYDGISTYHITPFLVEKIANYRGIPVGKLEKMPASKRDSIIESTLKEVEEHFKEKEKDIRQASAERIWKDKQCSSNGYYPFSFHRRTVLDLLNDVAEYRGMDRIALDRMRPDQVNRVIQSVIDEVEAKMTGNDEGGGESGNYSSKNDENRDWRDDLLDQTVRKGAQVTKIPGKFFKEINRALNSQGGFFVKTRIISDIHHRRECKRIEVTYQKPLASVPTMFNTSSELVFNHQLVYCLTGSTDVPEGAFVGRP